MEDLELVVKKELKEFFKIRENLYKFFDENLPKNKDDMVFDFSSHPKLDAQKIYELFYKYDYQARKVFGHTINYFNVKK